MRSRGFTLIETMMVLVVLAVAAAGIAGLQGNFFKQQSSMSTLQVKNQLLLECAEQILAIRKYYSDGYFAIASGTSYGTNLCGGLTALSGYTVPTVTITDPYSGAGCPTGGTCKLVVISESGAASITLMLANY
jgi:prepilin-type N-terminal cleavage/methylation domain-containing protein